MPEQYEVIDNAIEWCWFLETIGEPCDNIGVDFSNEVAIVVAIGGRPNTCYDVRVTCIKRQENFNKIHVEYVEARPGPNTPCPCQQVPVTPFHVVKVNRPVGPTKFVKKYNDNYQVNPYCAEDCRLQYEECLFSCDQLPDPNPCRDACMAWEDACLETCSSAVNPCP